MSRFPSGIDPLRGPDLIDRVRERMRVSAAANRVLGLELSPPEVEGVLDGLWAIGIGLRLIGEGWP